MKIHFLRLVALLAVFAVPALSQDTKTPDIEILERVYDAGEVQKGEMIEHTFKVKNNGKAPLQIFSARPSCGCTVASFDKTVMPGEIGKVAAKIDSNKLGPGNQTKTITVQSNDPDEGSILLQIKSQIISLATPIPPSLFLRTTRVKMEDLEFLIRPHERNPFKITSVSSDLDYLKFSIEEIKEIPEDTNHKLPSQRVQKGDYKIKVELDKEAPVGDVTGTVVVRTDSKQTPEVRVPIRGAITGLIAVTPKRVYMRVTDGSRYTVKEDVKLRFNPTIEAPEVGELKKGTSAEALPMPSTAKDADDWLRLRGENRVVGYVMKQFVKKDDSKQPIQTRTIRISKRDGNPFKISKVDTDLDGVKAEVTTDEDGRSYTVTLTFDGKWDRGSHRGEVEIKTNDSDEPSIKVPLVIQVT